MTPQEAINLTKSVFDLQKLTVQEHQRLQNALKVFVELANNEVAKKEQLKPPPKPSK